MQFSLDQVCIPNPYVCSAYSMNKKLHYFYKIFDTINGANCILQRLQEEFSVCFREKNNNPRYLIYKLKDIDLSVNNLIVTVQGLKRELKMEGRQDHDAMRYFNNLIDTFESELQGLIRHLSQFKDKQYLKNNSFFSDEKRNNFSQAYDNKMGVNNIYKNDEFTKYNVSEDCIRTWKDYLHNTTIKRFSNILSDSKLYIQDPMRKNHKEVQGQQLDECSASYISNKSQENCRKKLTKDKSNILLAYCNKSKCGISKCPIQNTFCMKPWCEYCKSNSFMNSSRNVGNYHNSKKSNSRVDEYAENRTSNKTKPKRGCRKSNITGREIFKEPLTNGTLKRSDFKNEHISRIFKTYSNDVELFKNNTFDQKYVKQINQYNVINNRLRSGRSNYKNSSRGRKLSVCFHSSRQLHPKENMKSREIMTKNVKNKFSSDSSVSSFSSIHLKTNEKKQGKKTENDNIWHANEARNLNVYRSTLEYPPKKAKKRNLRRRKSYSSSSRSQIDNTWDKDHVRKHSAFSPGYSSNNKFKKYSYYNVKKSRRRSHKCSICNPNSPSRILTRHKCRDCDPRISSIANLSSKSVSSHDLYYKYVKNPIRSRNLNEQFPSCRKCQSTSLGHKQSTVYLPRGKCSKCAIENVQYRPFRRRKTRTNNYITKNKRYLAADSESDIESTASCTSELSSFTCTEEQTVYDSESEQCESEDLKRNQSIKYIYVRKNSKSSKHKSNNENIRLGKCIDSCKKVIEFDVMPINKCSKSTGTNFDSEKTCFNNASTGHLTKLNVGTNTHNRCSMGQGTDPGWTTFPAVICKKKNESTNTEKTESELGQSSTNVSSMTESESVIKHFNFHKETESDTPSTKDQKTSFIKIERRLNVIENHVVDKEMHYDNILPEPNIEYEQTPRIEMADKILQTNSIDRPRKGYEKQVQTVQKETLSRGTNPDKIKLIEQNSQTEMKNTISRGVSPYKFKGLEKEIQTVKEGTISHGIDPRKIYRYDKEVQTSKKEAVSRGVDPEVISLHDKDIQTLRKELFSRAVDTDKKSFIDKNIQVPQIIPTPSVVTDIDYIEETENRNSESDLSMHLIFEKCHEDIYKKCKNCCIGKANFHSNDIGQRDVILRENRELMHDKYDNIPTHDKHYKAGHDEEICFKKLKRQRSSESTTCDITDIVTRNIKIILDKNNRMRNNKLDNSTKGCRLMEEDSGFADSNASYSDCTIEHSYWQSIANEIKDDYNVKV